jgi:hypothetical protein
MERCSACLNEITIIGRTCQGCGTLYCYGCAVYHKLINGNKCIICADIYGTDKELFAGVKSRQAIKDMQEYCAQCGIKKLFDTQGRVVNGDWCNDQYLLPEFQYAWVCSYKCYMELVERVKTH